VVLGLTAMVLAAAGCGTLPSPFPVIGPLPEGEAARVLDARARAVRSVYAVVRVSIDGQEFSGTFDVASSFQWPDRLRMSAFKDVLLGTRSIFDLAFKDGAYAFVLQAEEKAELRRGVLDRFPDENPRMAALFWMREALFLPGSSLGDPGVQGVRVIDPGSPTTPGRAESLISSGARAEWIFDPATLEVRNARIHPLGDAGPIAITYGGYRAVSGAFIPGDVRIEDPQEGFLMRAILRDLELNPDLDPSAFDIEAPAGMKQGTP